MKAAGIGSVAVNRKVEMVLGVIAGCDSEGGACACRSEPRWEAVQVRGTAPAQRRFTGLL